MLNSRIFLYVLQQNAVIGFGRIPLAQKSAIRRPANNPSEAFTMIFIKSVSADVYTVGLIYVKPLEMDTITVMLDKEHKSVPLQQGDYNEYTLGRIGMHNVAVVGPPIGAQGLGSPTIAP